MVEVQPSAPDRTATAVDERDIRRAQRRERLTRRYGWVGPGIGGFILVLLGVVFLAENLGYPVPEKWWTIFLIIPAIGALFAAWNAYQQDGRVSGEVAAPLIGGITLLVLATVLIFDFAWGLLWPLVLIAAGGAILLRTYWR
jgi:hypothetical protein